MSTYTQILYQVVFGTKDLTPFLNMENRLILFNYVAGICRNKKCIPYIIGGYSNHIHLIISLHPSQALSCLIKDTKVASNHMMSGNNDLFRSFTGWQVGFGGFTYHYSAIEKLIKYVQNQEEHHRKISFQEELIGFYKEFGIEYDTRYLMV